MDEDGVWAELLFPTFPRFGGNRFLEADDKDLALAMRARRGTTGCSTSGARRTPTASSRRRSSRCGTPRLAAREIERCAAKGSKAIIFVENPHPLGLPSFPTGHWGPVFEAAADTGLPLSMHIGTSSGLLRRRPRRHRRSASRCAASTR